jgi:Rhs element Vgr protein
MNVTQTIKINEKVVSDQFIFSIEINKCVNKITNAIIKLLDGVPAKEDFKLSDSQDYIPGSPVIINIGYDSDESIVFSGYVVKQNLQTVSDGPLLILHCKDESFKMAIGRKSDVFENITDSNLIKQLIENYSLTADVDSTSYENKEIVQWYCSDWDLMVMRAEVNGLIVITDQNKVSVKKPNTSQSKIITLTYGKDIYDIDVMADAKTQYSKVQANAWDIKSLQVINANASDPSVSLPGNLSPSKMAEFSDKDVFSLQTTANLEQTEIQNWADACLLKSRLSFISGEVKFQGNSAVLPGTIIELAGMGERFNGNAFVWEVTQTVEGGNWFTEVTLGADANWYTANTADIESPKAAGLLPGVSGLQNGIVKQINSDPLNEFRVLVTLPLVNNKTVWARLCTTYATSNAGTYFFPEVGDEVLLGFFNEDPRFPVILGSMYSSSKQSPFTPESTNATKAIVSKNGVKIIFDDEKKALTIVTPQNNTIVLSDDEKSISLNDQNGNKIEMNSSGITIQSASNIVLKASENVNIEATSNISIQATNALDLKGLNVSGSADAQMVMKGEASSEFSASGEVTIKGAMVMIN